MHQLLPASLKRRRPGRIRPRLDGLQRALEGLGNPQHAFPSILIVGTNGKGSTAAMVEAILAAHGLKVGLYTSPHLVRVEERIRIGGRPIDRAGLERHLEVLDAFSDLTFFETLTAAAFLAFAAGGVQCAVLEAGMGGRWDATRLAGSEIAGLTNVGSDHRGWLGESVADRARDKGAALMAASHRIIDDGVPGDVVEHLGDGPFQRVAEIVTHHEIGSSRVRLSWAGDATEIEPPLPGWHQLANLRLALALAVSAARAGWLRRLSPEKVRRGLGRVEWPGRLSHHRIAGRRVLMDCAHNREGARALADHLESGPVLYHLLFSCLEDKPLEDMASALWPHVGNVIVYQLDDERAMPLDRLHAAFPGADAAPSVEAGLLRLPDPVVAAGSLRVVGDLLAVGPQEGGP